MPDRIEICGGMASGKTTLASLLGDISAAVSYEKFSKVPFWKEFYVDPGRFAFETETGFLLQHYHQIKLATDTGSRVVCDFSLIQDRAYAEVNLTGSQKEAFLSVYEEVQRELGRPDLIVHLNGGETEELRRIRARARPEESDMDIEYLAKVNAAVSRFVPSDIGMIVEIDSESVNFAHNAEDKESVRDKIRQALSV